MSRARHRPGDDHGIERRAGQGTDHDPPTPGQVPKSRSQLRREEDERQDIAGRLVDLPAAKVDRLPLDEDVRAAIRAAAAVRQHVPRRRARLHVATLLREMSLEDLHALARRIEAGGYPTRGS